MAQPCIARASGACRHGAARAILRESGAALGGVCRREPVSRFPTRVSVGVLATAARGSPTSARGAPPGARGRAAPRTARGPARAYSSAGAVQGIQRARSAFAASPRTTFVSSVPPPTRNLRT